MRDANELLLLWQERALLRAPLLRQMSRVRRTYNDELDLDLPEQYKLEEPAVSNMLEDAVDQIAQRVASTLPDVAYPPLRPGKESSEERARKRRQVNLAWWEMNDVEGMLQRRASQLLAYAVSPVIVRPKRWRDGTVGPAWTLRDPFGVYPGETENPDDVAPPDCIYAYQRSWGWINRNYPDQADRIERPRDGRDSDMFTLLEYVDDREVSLFVVGSRNRQPNPAIIEGVRGRDSIWTPRQTALLQGSESIVSLERTDNRAEMCWAVVPQRTTLDKPKGKFDGMIGKYIARARLFALEYIAVTAGVFPDQWVYSDDANIEPKIETMANGRKGKIGKIVGGKIVPIVTNPGYMTPQMSDRLERNERLEGGFPADLSGESGTNIRTGRRGDAVLGAAIDYTIQAAQRMLQHSMQAENRIAAAEDQAYSGSARKSYYFAWTKDSGTVDYTPNDIWETDRNVVRFPFAGVDAQGLIIGVGQRLGLETMSRRTAMENDPMVRDVEAELDRINSEAVRSAFWAFVQQQVSQGQFAATDILNLSRYITAGNMEPEDALERVQAEAQQRQASAGPPGSPEAPVDPNAPAAQPGVSAPGQGAEAGTIGLPASAHDFSGMLSELYPTQAALASAGRQAG